MDKAEWKIAWSDALSVDVPEMDEEHRQFIARVNDVNKAIIDALDKTTVAHLMDLMQIEAARHFQHEQQLLEQWNYPDATAHAERHAQLIAKFNHAMKEFQESDLSFVWALKGLQIKQSLVEHLLREDMKYKEFLRSQKRSH